MKIKRNRDAKLVFNFREKIETNILDWFKGYFDWFEEYYDKFNFRIFFKDGKKTNTFANITNFKRNDWYIYFPKNSGNRDVKYCPSIEINKKNIVFFDHIDKIEVYYKRI